MMMIHCVAVYNLIMDSDTKEDNEDFLDLQGTSTKARVKERRIKLDQERMSMAEKTRERVARCRSKKNDEEKKDARQKDRQKKAEARGNQNEEEKKEARQRDRQKKAEARGKLNEVEREDMRRKDRERKAKKAAEKAATNAEEESADKKVRKEYMRNEKYENMMYKRKIRAKMTPEEKEYSKIENVIAVRKHRESRDGKKLLMDRMKARQGMEDFWKFGRIGEFATRETRDKDESELWKWYCRGEPEQRALLETLKPDEAAKVRKEEEEEYEDRRLLNEKIKAMDEERERKDQEDERKYGGRWTYNHEYAKYCWVGTGPPPPDEEDDEYDEPTEEEKQQMMEQENEWLQAELEEKKKANADCVRRHRERQKAAMDVPIEIPDYPLSEYELIRQKNIEDIQNAMKASGLFDM